ncbi:Protein F56F11.4, isoform a [Aphelenchoides besseyi]|nr:Protein F56F11.4, isoform a [Aphelenchoides besseyi]
MTPPDGVAVVSPQTVNQQDAETRENSLQSYYKTKILDSQQQLGEKAQNVRRLQAQRNELNSKVRALKEELMQLHEQGSYVGEVSKAMDKKKVLVKVHPEGKYVVDIDKRNVEFREFTSVLQQQRSFDTLILLTNKFACIELVFVCESTSLREYLAIS